MSADPELFFPISTSGPALGQVDRAKTICQGCRVQRQCLDFALATDQVHGVWGGTTEEERRRLRRRLLRSPAPGGPVPARAGRQGQRGQRQRAS